MNNYNIRFTCKLSITIDINENEKSKIPQEECNQYEYVYELLGNFNCLKPFDYDINFIEIREDFNEIYVGVICKKEKEKKGKNEKEAIKKLKTKDNDVKKLEKYKIIGEKWLVIEDIYQVS